MPTESCSIPSFNPATGRISTRSLSRSKRLSRHAGPQRRVKSARQRPARKAFRITSLERESLYPMRSLGRSRAFNSAFDVRRSMFGVFPEPGKFNAQHSTLNVQRSIYRLRVERWALDVERWTLKCFRRVKGAWWPPRSSKPPSVGNGRDRFDSYPLRQLIFDFRFSIFDRRLESRCFCNRNSKFEIAERG